MAIHNTRSIVEFAAALGVEISPAYVAVENFFGDYVTYPFRSWQECLDKCKELASRKGCALVYAYNENLADYATDTGWDDGLTEEQRDELETALASIQK